VEQGASWDSLSPERQSGSCAPGDWGHKTKRTHSTNKAIKLLKTKERQNEQSQTKPFLVINLLKTKENHYQQSHYLVENKEASQFNGRLAL
jgi:hypothetical protein